jgi:hypothetical protein
MVDYKLKDSIVTLHDIARTVESKIGVGTISQKIRNSADDLALLLTEEMMKSKDAKQ